MADVAFPHQNPDTMQRDMSAAMAPDSATKVSKPEVNYRAAGSSETRCGNCVFYQGQGICSRVEGNISPDGVCDLYQSRGPGLMDLVSGKQTVQP